MPNVTTLTKPIPQTFPTVLFDDVIFSMSKTVGDLVVHCILDIDGRVDFPRLKQATRYTIDIEPICGCKYVPGWWRSRWERRGDIDDVEWCTLVETTPDQVAAERERFLIQPNIPTKDPLVLVRVIRADTDIICIKVNHIIVDGGGLKEYAYLLASVYRALATKNELSITPNTTGDRDFHQVWSRFGFKQRCALFFQRMLHDAKLLFPLKGWRFPHDESVSHRERQTYVFHHLSEDEFHMAKDVGRRNGATINDVILTACYRAMKNVIKPSKAAKRILSTADLRRYLPDGSADSLCNLSGWVHPYINRDLGPTFVDTLEQVKALMGQNKQHYIGLGDFMTVPPMLKPMPHSWAHKLLCFAFRQASKFLHPVMTNMGRVFPDQVDLGDVDIANAYLTASVVYPPAFVMSVSGFGNRITLARGLCGDTNQSKELFAHMVDEIKVAHEQSGATDNPT